MDKERLNILIECYGENSIVSIEGDNYTVRYPDGTMKAEGWFDENNIPTEGERSEKLKPKITKRYMRSQYPTIELKGRNIPVEMLVSILDTFSKVHRGVNFAGNPTNLSQAISIWKKDKRKKDYSIGPYNNMTSIDFNY